jgi:hypothetical protein
MEPHVDVVFQSFGELLKLISVAAHKPLPKNQGEKLFHGCKQSGRLTHCATRNSHGKISSSGTWKDVSVYMVEADSR